MNQMSIPASDPNDNDDVALALQTAEALWNKGDPDEALRWLRRAAEAAGDSGDDMRAVALAKAVAELNQAGPESSPQKRVRPPPLPSQTTSTPTEAAAHAGDVGAGEASNVTDAASDASSTAPTSVRKAVPKPPSPPSIKPRAEALGADTEPPKPAQKKLLNPPPTPPVRPQNGDGSRKGASLAPSAPPAASLGLAVGGEGKPLATPSNAPTKIPGAPSISPPARTSKATSPSLEQPGVGAQVARTFARAAVRVYVVPKAYDGSALDVHVLEAGQRPPAGAVEAMLVPIRQGAKLVK